MRELTVFILHLIICISNLLKTANSYSPWAYNFFIIIIQEGYLCLRFGRLIIFGGAFFFLGGGGGWAFFEGRGLSEFYSTVSTNVILKNNSFL